MKSPCIAIVCAVVALTGRDAWGATTGGAPRFYFGNDLSYVNQMEDCGAVFRENGVARDPYAIFADHGTNLVRVRLWHDPWWQPLLPQSVPGVKPQYSDLADVTETISRAKAAGMRVLLDFQFSDFWADPGRQVIPRVWSAMAGDDNALEVVVHDYVAGVLTTLEGQNLMPELVQLGNETNNGLLIEQTLNATWNAGAGQLAISTSGIRRTENTHFARMWNAAIRAVREVGATARINPRICLHAAGPDPAVGFFDWVQQIGVTDFDVMGLSYYYAWHHGSIANTGNRIRELRTKHPGREVMILETGYPWDQQNIDGLANIISEPDPAFLPVNKENQRRYMVALTQEVIDAGGIGVVFWEPAWVSTPCRTPWGVGSSHEHVAYFDHRDGNNFHVGGTWMEASYPALQTAPAITTPPVNMTVRNGASAAFSVFATGDALTYTWRHNGATIPDASGPVLFIAAASPADAGDYVVNIANAVGNVTSSAATLTLVASGDVRLVNLSARAQVGAGAGILIPGFVVAGGGAKSLLIRAVGPRLADFNVSGVLANPTLRVVPLGLSVDVAANDNWGDAANLAAMESVRDAVSAFAFSSSTLDSSILAALPSGAFTAPAAGVGGGTGVALVELYDADPATTPARLINLSARARVGTGADLLIPGFFVQGDVAPTLLIRAIGPGLQPFGVTGVLANPVMTLYRSKAGGGSDALVCRDDWEDDADVPALIAATAAVQAFALTPGSRDAAILIALNPGGYTVAVSGVLGGTGVALVEVYVVAS